MDPHWVEVLNRADDNTVVGLVADDLYLIFLPAEKGDLNEDFGGGGHVESPTGDGLEFLTVVGDSSSRSTQCKGGTDDERIGSDLLRDFEDLINRVGGA